MSNIYSEIIGKKGIHKESRMFFLVEVLELVYERNDFLLKLNVLGNRFARYDEEVGTLFEDIDAAIIPERQFLFGPVNPQQIKNQLEEEEGIAFIFVMYIGELILGDDLALSKFEQEDASFWE